MSAPEAVAPYRSHPLSELPRLPRDHGGPLFAEPWQAQAFALAVTLSQQGHFTWKEWAAALARELDAAARNGEPDDGARYYEHWLAALERLVVEKGLADAAALMTRKAAWVSAYETTPHGQPIELPPSRASALRWLAAGMAGTILPLWILQTLSVGSLDPGAGSTAWSFATTGSGSIGLSLASAGFGALLGMRHALEPDHLAAVTTLMTGARSSLTAALLGACWGVGHTLTLFVTGVLFVLLQAELPAPTAGVFEMGVVLLLVFFGVRAIRLGAWHRRIGPTHSHRPPAFAPLRADRWTLGRPLLVGALHGLAGSGALMAVLVTTIPSSSAQLSYLLLFGVGSTAGMTVLSGLLGWPLARLGAHHFVGRVFSVVAGGFSIALGVWLALSALRAS